MEHSYSNIASYLPRMAELQPERLAIAFPTRKLGPGKFHYAKWSFAQLNHESDKIAYALEQEGVTKGVRSVLMVKPSLEFFALTFALFKVGAVPVLIDPGIGLKHLKECIDEAEPEAFIGIPMAHLARALQGWGKRTLKKKISVGPSLFFGGTSLKSALSKVPKDFSYKTRDTASEDTAAILFTSGSTGVPKGAVYTHGNFIAQVDEIKRIYDIRPGEIDLPTFPLFALFDPALGMSTVIPHMDATKPAKVEPENIVEPIKEFNVTNMFGSPALLNRVSRYGEANNVQLPSLKRVISAGAPASPVVLQRFSDMLEEAGAIHTPYGATESLPVSTISSKEILSDTAEKTNSGMGVCVGKPVPSVDVQVIPISDEVISDWEDCAAQPKWEVGEIVVKGPQVTASYFNRPKSTELAKIRDGAFIRHRMGDLGYFDSDGRLWFCGRKAHRVDTAEGSLYPVPVEGVFNTHPKVFRSALVRVDVDGSIQPALCIELEDKLGKGSQEELFSELKSIGAQYPHTENINLFFVHFEFPVDIRHNAKINREHLSVWANEQLKRLSK